jgi:hypothetical protein
VHAADGAYSEEGSGWRLGEGYGDVASHGSHTYNELIEGELTFGWPASFELVREEVGVVQCSSRTPASFTRPF